MTLTLRHTRKRTACQGQIGKLGTITTDVVTVLHTATLSAYAEVTGQANNRKSAVTGLQQQQMVLLLRGGMLGTSIANPVSTSNGKVQIGSGAHCHAASKAGVLDVHHVEPAYVTRRSAKV